MGVIDRLNLPDLRLRVEDLLCLSHVVASRRYIMVLPHMSLAHRRVGQSWCRRVIHRHLYLTLLFKNRPLHHQGRPQYESVHSVTLETPAQPCSSSTGVASDSPAAAISQQHSSTSPSSV